MKQHSTTSKKTFMKATGLDSHGSDIDEIIASPKAEWKRPWWVRTVDEPTVEIDWQTVQRFDATKIQQVSFTKYVGKEKRAAINKLKKQRTKQWVLENKPGYSLRDLALDIAGRQGSVKSSFRGNWYNAANVVEGFRKRIYTYEELGVPRWEGTPEENARMIRAAAVNFGASQVGFVELDERNRKFVYSIDSDGKKLDFEEVDMAYETENQRVIPNKVQWAIVFTVQMSEELYKRRLDKMPTSLSGSTTGLGYSRARNIFDRLQTFLHVIGYQCLMSPWENGLGIAPAFGVMAGLGELSRLNKIISPEYGPTQRVFRMLTDLPLAPTRPIDAGIMRFCRTCKKCAIECPSNALSTDIEPSWEIKGQWNSPGHRAYFEDGVKCSGYWLGLPASCSTCMSVCPFAKKDRTFMHHVVEAIVAKTPLLNGFFTKMDGLLGYDNPKDPESWWDLSLPIHSIDPTTGTLFDK
ncbi:reductive dehalogenase [Chloroflexota bacterium]